MRLDDGEGWARAMPTTLSVWWFFAWMRGVKKKLVRAANKSVRERERKKNRWWLILFFFEGREGRKKNRIDCSQAELYVYRPTVIFEAPLPLNYYITPSLFFSRWFHLDFFYSSPLFSLLSCEGGDGRKNYRHSRRHYKCTFFSLSSLSLSFLPSKEKKINR